ncbi:MAG: 50S ribosomal protein L3 [Kiritimatiellales bacterium]|nr:50S ribosomal protein L3 [Kiritimatiellales bacterium]
MKGLIGKKLGMTQVYDEAGTMVPVTVIEAGPCVVVQQKTADNDGYEAVQLGFEDQKEQRLTKPSQGHFKKAGVAAKRILREVPLDGDGINIGDVLTAALFEDVAHVDVIATGKGRGYQGAVKRHGFSGGRASHGSHMHRRVGSIGMCEHPARVFKGKKMPGHMGNKRVTTQNLKIVQIRAEENLILLKGSVPGANGGIVILKEALKK